MVSMGYLGRSGTSMHQIVALMASNKETISQNQMYVCIANIILKIYLIEFVKNFRDVRKV